MSANSAAVNSPYPTTSSLAGRVQGAVEERSTWTPAPPAAMSTTLHWPVVMRAAASRMAGIPIALGRLVHGPSPSSRTICAQSVPTTPSTSRGEMPASANAPIAPMRAMDVESCSGRARACTVLWTPAMATPPNGCGEGRVDGLLNSEAAATWCTAHTLAWRADLPERTGVACAAAGKARVGPVRKVRLRGLGDRGPRGGEQQAPSASGSASAVGAPRRHGAGPLARVRRLRGRRGATGRTHRLAALPKGVGLPLRHAEGPPGLRGPVSRFGEPGRDGASRTAEQGRHGVQSGRAKGER